MVQIWLDTLPQKMDLQQDIKWYKSRTRFPHISSDFLLYRIFWFFTYDFPKVPGIVYLQGGEICRGFASLAQTYCW